MTSNKSMLQADFEMVFDLIPKIEFDPEWQQGDYLNGAVRYELEPGIVKAAQQPGENLRRVILIGTRVGTVAIFERYSPNGTQPFVLVSNAKQSVRFILPSGSMDHAQFLSAINPYDFLDNLGSRIDNLFDTPKRDVIC